MTQSKANSLLALHSADRLLLLPNIWDPLGARILESKGFPAVATSSAAVASSLGFRDGEQLTFETHLSVLKRIADSITVPVTADLESGYAGTLRQLADNIRRVIDAGIAGINFEDSLKEGVELRSIDEQSERIAVVRETSEKTGIHLVINARVDPFLTGSFPDDIVRIEECVRRAEAYMQAGADCIYPIGAAKKENILELRRRISAPLNILAMPTAPRLKELQEIGINRVSLGPYLFRSVLAKLVRIIDDMKEMKDYGSFADGMLTGDEALRFLRERKEDNREETRRGE